MEKKIFISHSSLNCNFTAILLDFLRALGVSENVIFHSSDPKTGVRNVITKEVKEALNTTVIDIIVLSNEYKQSDYCLNEAGIIWFKEDRAQMLIVAFPEIDGGECVGFIKSDSINYRLMEKKRMMAFADRLCEELLKNSLISTNTRQQSSAIRSFVKRTEAFKRTLPVVDNLSIAWANDVTNTKYASDIMEARKNVQEIIKKDKVKQNCDLFYKDYSRTIIISSTNDSDKVTVKTYTSYTIVNLTDIDYNEHYSAQFMKADGGLSSFYYESFRINGEDYKRTVDNIDSLDIATYDPIYHLSREIKVCVKAHTSDKIEFVTSYEIKPLLFFQSKVLNLPCGSYKLQAQFDSSFLKSKDHNYIFRFQIIPPNPRESRDLVIPAELNGESVDKRMISQQYSAGFPSGGGYAITICETK